MHFNPTLLPAFSDQVFTQHLLPPLNADIIKNILSQTRLNNCWQKIYSESTLTSLSLVSKAWYCYIPQFLFQTPQLNPQTFIEQIKLEKQAWMPKTEGCQTAREAVDLISAKELCVANLEWFPDLTENLLQELMEKNPQIVHLKIQSNLIKTLPEEECLRLQTLICSNLAIKVLPEKMPNLTWLNCANTLVESIHLYPNLLKLICYSNPNLHTLPPGMMYLKEISCNNNPRLNSLPSGLIRVERIDCSDCPLLIGIPLDLKKIADFACFKNPNLILPDDFETKCMVRREKEDLSTQDPYYHGY